MPREDANAKGARYLVEARLTVERVTDGLVRASCRGDGAVYALGWNPRRGWYCQCPALARCSHLYALGRVVVVPNGLLPPKVAEAKGTRA